MSTDGLLTRADVVYPESDGQPIAENTLQFEWISTLKWGYDGLFRDDPNVFVAGDLLWYPVEGDNVTRIAPDVLVAFGRPKGHRGSYQQWREGGTSPQVVFEILSPGNRAAEMIKKFRFYERFGVEEYYIYDPDRREMNGWIREGATLGEVPEVDGFTSPRLGTRFELGGGDLKVLDPQGRRFLTVMELGLEREAERSRAERLAARLRGLGVDPESA